MAEGCTLPSWQPPTIPNCSGSAPKTHGTDAVHGQRHLEASQKLTPSRSVAKPRFPAERGVGCPPKALFFGKKMRQKRFQGLKTPSHRSLAIQGWAGWFVSVADTHSHFSGRYKYRSF